MKIRKAVGGTLFVSAMGVAGATAYQGVESTSMGQSPDQQSDQTAEREESDLKTTLLGSAVCTILMSGAVVGLLKLAHDVAFDDTMNM